MLMVDRFAVSAASPLLKSLWYQIHMFNVTVVLLYCVYCAGFNTEFVVLSCDFQHRKCRSDMSGAGIKTVFIVLLPLTELTVVSTCWPATSTSTSNHKHLMEKCYKCPPISRSVLRNCAGLSESILYESDDIVNTCWFILVSFNMIHVLYCPTLEWKRNTTHSRLLFGS